VNTLILLLVAVLFVVAAMWHNKSPRSEGEHESETPDPAVLSSRRSVNSGKQARSVPVETQVERPRIKQRIGVSTK
jgi:hypothetical protein